MAPAGWGLRRDWVRSVATRSIIRPVVGRRTLAGPVFGRTSPSSPGFGAIFVEEATGRTVDSDQRVADDCLGALFNGLRPSLLVEVRRGKAKKR
jgi:hypothetical protein